MSGGGEALRVEDVRVRFGGVRALTGVSIRVGAGTVHGLIGPNGAGKTTLFNVVTGLVRPDSGRVFVCGHEVTRSRPHRRTRYGMGRTFQRLELFSSLTVRENVQVAAESVHPLWRRTASAAKLADGALERVGLTAHAAERPDALPIGTARLVELARALALEPSLVLLDEPASGLGPEETRALGMVVRGVAADGVGVLLVEHDMGLVMNICDTLDVMDGGQVIARGTPAQVQQDERVLEAYLGAGHAAEGLPG